MIKKVLVVIGALLVVLAGTFFFVFGEMLFGNAELVDGTELPGGGRIVKDGYVAIDVLPAGEKEVALVDCGNDANGAAVLKELQRRGLGPDDVRAVFLTHGHPDHIAACHLFKNAEIVALAGDVPIAEGAARAKGPLPSKLDTPKEKLTKISKVGRDGEHITVGTLEVKVYALPGHTAGSAAYLVNGALYLGDSANGASDGKLKPAPWVVSDDTAQNRRSLVALAKRLADEGAKVDRLVFSHTGPLDGMKALAEYKAQ